MTMDYLFRGVAEPEDVDIVLYHGNCADGAASATIFRTWLKHNTNHWEKVEFIPVFHKKPPPDVKGKTFAIFDFSYPANTLIEMMNKCKACILIDHHKTAVENLYLLLDFDKSIRKELMEECKQRLSDDTFDEKFAKKVAKANTNLHYRLNLDHCGCVLVYDWLHGDLDELPEIYKYVEDRDLWQWELEGSREFSTALFYKHDWSQIMDVFEELTERTIESETIKSMIEYGKPFLEAKTKDAKSRAKSSRYFKWKPRADSEQTFEIRIVNCVTNYSEVGEAILEYSPSTHIACVWYYDAWNKFWSFHLRSRQTDENVDVSKICKFFGGGGHLHSAAFKLDFDDPRAMDWIKEDVKSFDFYEKEEQETKKRKTTGTTSV